MNDAGGAIKLTSMFWNLIPASAKEFKTGLIPANTAAEAFALVVLIPVRGLVFGDTGLFRKLGTVFLRKRAAGCFVWGRNLPAF